MLAAELRLVPHVRGSQKLVVTNFGPSIARNIWVTFDPLLPDPDPATVGQSVTPSLKKRYANAISVMAPGMVLENIYYSGRIDGQGKFKNFEPVPDQVKVTLVYEDTGGSRFRDVFRLDINLLQTTTDATSSGAPEAQVKKIAKALESIDKFLRRRQD